MRAAAPQAEAPAGPGAETVCYVTVEVAGQLFGIPIERVHDVFVVSGLTRVPLAPPEVAGLVNLRGRVVTALDLRRRFGLPETGAAERPMAVGIEAGSEFLGLIVDAVGEVLRLDRESRDDNPVHLAERWAALASGVHRLEDRLLVVLDVDAVLNLDRTAQAA